MSSLTPRPNVATLRSGDQMKNENGKHECACCGGPLDGVALCLLEDDPHYFRNGILGKCCDKPGRDDGWNDDRGDYRESAGE